MDAIGCTVKENLKGGGVGVMTVIGPEYIAVQNHNYDIKPGDYGFILMRGNDKIFLPRAEVEGLYDTLGFYAENGHNRPKESHAETTRG